jgi:hypothetical protein
MKKAYKILFLIIVFLSQFKVTYSQDSCRYFFEYDLIKGLIHENSFTLGYNLPKKKFITASIGYAYSNNFLRSSMDLANTSPSDLDYPILIYKGPVFRASINKMITPLIYIGFEGLYKHVFYNNSTFEDGINNGGSTIFTRDEKADVIGYHLQVGYITNPLKNELFYINPSIGFGFIKRFRNINTTDSYWHGGEIAPPPLGRSYDKKTQVSLEFCLKIGMLQPKCVSITDKKLKINKYYVDKVDIKSKDSSIRRNILIIKHKNPKRNFLLKEKKMVEIITFDKNKITGKFVMVKDSSIIIMNKKTFATIPIKDIQILYCNKSLGHNITSAGLILSVGILFRPLGLLLSIPAVIYEFASVRKNRFDTNVYDLKIKNYF